MAAEQVQTRHLLPRLQRRSEPRRPPHHPAGPPAPADPTLTPDGKAKQIRVGSQPRDPVGGRYVADSTLLCSPRVALTVPVNSRYILVTSHVRLPCLCPLNSSPPTWHLHWGVLGSRLSRQACLGLPLLWLNPPLASSSVTLPLPRSTTLGGCKSGFLFQECPPNSLHYLCASPSSKRP